MGTLFRLRVGECRRVHFVGWRWGTAGAGHVRWPQSDISPPRQFSQCRVNVIGFGEAPLAVVLGFVLSELSPGAAFDPLQSVAGVIGMLITLACMSPERGVFDLMAGFSTSPFGAERRVGPMGSEFETAWASKLGAVGLIPKPEEKAAVTLGPFIKEYVDDRTDVKPATKQVWRQGKMKLIEFFGANKPLKEITAGDADRYKLQLSGKKLAPITVRKRLQFATMIFRAVRRRLIAESPFADVSIKASMPNRERFITADETAKLLEACPNTDWRVIVALARYGGLHCPSEVHSLRWRDIDWDAGRIVVTSPKTEHHLGNGTRTIPLFPELRPSWPKPSTWPPKARFTWSMNGCERVRKATRVVGIATCERNLNGSSSGLA